MKWIEPTIFSGPGNVLAVFTESGRSSGDRQGKGVDFGINTSTERVETDRNYKRLLSEFNIETDSIALARQVHGSHIEVVDEPGVYKDTDGLITKRKRLALGIQVADCAAILIGDYINQVIGAFHAGWRGAVANIVPKGLQKMEEAGGERDNFKVYISPCISEAMFEVGEKVAVQFPDSFVDRKTYKKPHVDLKGFLKQQMTEYGVNPKQIEVSKECTMQDSRFFSYRKEQEKAGRMIGLIVLKN